MAEEEEPGDARLAASRKWLGDRDGFQGAQIMSCTTLATAHGISAKERMKIASILARNSESVHWKYGEDGLVRYPSRDRAGGILDMCEALLDVFKNKTADDHEWLVQALKAGLESVFMIIDGKQEKLILRPLVDTFFLQGIAANPSFSARGSHISRHLYGDTTAQHAPMYRIRRPLLELRGIDAAFRQCERSRTYLAPESLGAMLVPFGNTFGGITDMRAKLDMLQILVGKWDPEGSPADLEKIEQADAKAATLTGEEKLPINRKRPSLACSPRSSKGGDSGEDKLRFRPGAWLGTKQGHKWLESDDGQKWLNCQLTVTEDGREVPVDFSLIWLKETDTGRAWLKSDAGKRWQRTYPGICERATPAARLNQDAFYNIQNMPRGVFWDVPPTTWQYVRFEPKMKDA
ncbi:Uu.00g012640.m01.CDS01 [Anthostomella pinea]|uniref:Uu.00g012640.m01.CDS01 n=1 Tax=Anthostomella pinea TaxID=933095 RepID=A0AAI8YQ88_9PEZI|nr:Uu.00g012640.m01.CDS01 [Anthostomella pinea]